MTDALHWVAAIWAGFATKPVKSATAFSTTFVAVRALWSAVWDQAQFARRTGHRAYIQCCTRCTVRVFFLAAAAAGVRYFSEGAAAERGYVRMWRQEMAVVKKAYNALYKAQGLFKAVAALMRVPAVPVDFDRLISSGRLIHVASYRPHYYRI